MDTPRRIVSPGTPAGKSSPPGAREPVMLTPQNARRIVCRRTGGTVSAPTFYRWLSSGKIVSIRLGYHIFIPYYAVDEFIEKCLKGERV
jgi:excisionase family DNA binding protein